MAKVRPLMQQEEKGMQRDEWQFDYVAGKVAEGARAKLAYHRQRLAYYTKTKDDLMTRIKAEGLEIVESVGRYSGSPGEPTVAVRNDLNLQLQECVRKEKHHRAQVLEYDGWAQVLEANPESRLKLHHEDWLHFFGANRVTMEPEPEEE